MKEQIENKIKEKNRINIGEMSFSVEDLSLFEPKIQNNCRIVSATPIVIRIPKIHYEKYGIISDKEYIYWRPEYDFNVFVKQLEENLIKKYNEFYKTDIEEFPIFEQFVYKKPTCSHVIINGREQKLIGSVWEFIFSHIDSERRKLLEFGKISKKIYS